MSLRALASSELFAWERLACCDRILNDGGGRGNVARRGEVGIPLIDAVRTHLRRKPYEVSGDADFDNEANLTAFKQRRITAYLAPVRARHGEADTTGCGWMSKSPLMSSMAARLDRAGGCSRYCLRKQVVEPVCKQIKQARRFRQFLLRGVDQVRGE